MKMKLTLIVEVQGTETPQTYEDGITNCIIEQIQAHTGIKKDKMYLDDYEVIESEFV